MRWLKPGLALVVVIAAAAWVLSRAPTTALRLSCPAWETLTPLQARQLEWMLSLRAEWETREARVPGGVAWWAVRRDPVPPAPDGGLQSALGGDARADTDGGRSRRVLVSFGPATPPTTGRPGTEILSADGVERRVALRPSGNGGLASNVRVPGGAGVFVELFERTSEPRLPFTERAFAELCALLGELPQPESGQFEPPEVPERGRPWVVVQDGMQPGIYLVVGRINPGEPGTVTVRVFEEGSAGPLPEVVAPGQQLSAERIEPRTAQPAAHSGEAAMLFPYNSELTVYEGDWGQPYDARFELYFSPATGAPGRVLASTRRTIEGWMR